jgi:Zn-dependent protease
MLGIPAETPYDLRFRLLGIPVRVHPFFWLIMAAIGFTDDVRATVVFVLCGFLSILFHEFGHGLMSRVFGQRPSIVLYGMGGLCYYGSLERETPGRRLLVLICGPLAGFLLGGAAYAASQLGGSRISPTAYFALNVLSRINIYWSVLNLLPIWPLDGGQMAEVVLTRINAGNGKRWGHVISLVVSGVLAILIYSKFGQDQLVLIFWFGYFAFTIYQVLQMLNYHARYGGYGD